MVRASEDIVNSDSTVGNINKGKRKKINAAAVTESTEILARHKSSNDYLQDLGDRVDSSDRPSISFNSLPSKAQYPAFFPLLSRLSIAELKTVSIPPCIFVTILLGFGLFAVLFKQRISKTCQGSSCFDNSKKTSLCKTNKKLSSTKRKRKNLSSSTFINNSVEPISDKNHNRSNNSNENGNQLVTVSWCSSNDGTSGGATVTTISRECKDFGEAGKRSNETTKVSTEKHSINVSVVEGNMETRQENVKDDNEDNEWKLVQYRRCSYTGKNDSMITCIKNNQTKVQSDLIANRSNKLRNNNLSVHGSYRQNPNPCSSFPSQQEAISRCKQSYSYKQSTKNQMARTMKTQRRNFNSKLHRGCDDNKSYDNDRNCTNDVQSTSQENQFQNIRSSLNSMDKITTDYLLNETDELKINKVDECSIVCKESHSIIDKGKRSSPVTIQLESPSSKEVSLSSKSAALTVETKEEEHDKFSSQHKLEKLPTLLNCVATKADESVDREDIKCITSCENEKDSFDHISGEAPFKIDITMNITDKGPSDGGPFTNISDQKPPASYSGTTSVGSNHMGRWCDITDSDYSSNNGDAEASIDHEEVLQSSCLVNESSTLFKEQQHQQLLKTQRIITTAMNNRFLEREDNEIFIENWRSGQRYNSRGNQGGKFSSNNQSYNKNNQRFVQQWQNNPNHNIHEQQNFWNNNIQQYQSNFNNNNNHHNHNHHHHNRNRNYRNHVRQHYDSDKLEPFSYSTNKSSSNNKKVSSSSSNSLQNSQPKFPNEGPPRDRAVSDCRYSSAFSVNSISLSSNHLEDCASHCYQPPPLRATAATVLAAAASHNSKCVTSHLSSPVCIGVYMMDQCSNGSSKYYHNHHDNHQPILQQSRSVALQGDSYNDAVHQKDETPLLRTYYKDGSAKHQSVNDDYDEDVAIPAFDVMDNSRCWEQPEGLDCTVQSRKTYNKDDDDDANRYDRSHDISSRFSISRFDDISYTNSNLSPDSPRFSEAVDLDDGDDDNEDVMIRLSLRKSSSCTHIGLAE